MGDGCLALHNQDVLVKFLVVAIGLQTVQISLES